MWNGLWKLTVMVGVIGIGLFAAYQAQKGMNLTLTSAPKESDDSKTERALEPTVEKPSFDLSSDQQEPVVSKSQLEPTERATERRLKKSEQPFDFLDDFADDRSQAKKSVASNKTSDKVIPAKRTQKRPGVNFREDTESVDDGQAQPQPLPDDVASAVPPKKPAQPIRQVKADSIDSSASNTNAVATVETEADPFAEDASNGDAASKTSEPAKSNDADKADFTEQTTSQDVVDSQNDEPAKKQDDAPKQNDSSAKKRSTAEAIEKTKIERPSQPAGRARVSTEFSGDSEPPRSRRAKQNAGKRVETEANPFEIESAPDPKTPSTTEFPSSKSMRESEAPGRIDELPKEDPVSRQESSTPTVPRSLPDDISTISGDDPGTTRPQPKRTRPAVPAQLSDDFNVGSLNEPPPKTRDAQPRRAERNQTSPVDMIGDGLVGDASQRGLQQPRLTIEKVAQQQAVIEQPFIYSIIVKNTGTVDAHNVVIEDRIPKGTELLGTAPQAELSGKRLIWNHLVLKPNEEKKISIKVVPKQEGPVGSVARVYFATEVSAEIVVAAPQLEFTVKAPSEVRIGQHFDLIFTLKNVGTVDASNIIVRDLVPDELKHEAGSDIECPIGKMAPQECREIVLPVTAIKTGSLINQAILTADSSIKKSLDSSINVIGEVLVLTRTGHNRLYVEKPATFTNNIRNDGNRKADRIRISEVVPAGMQFETASDGGKYDDNLRAVVWTVGPLAPGADKSLTVNYVPKETGTHAAKITATGNAGSTAAVQSSIDVIGKPELQMETLSATGAVTVGDRVTSKFQLNNTGTAVAKSVQLKIRLPRELRLISVKGAKFQHNKDENIVLFETIGELPPRTKAAYELVLEPITEADAQIGLEISAEHLTKPGRRIETIQIARDALK